MTALWRDVGRAVAKRHGIEAGFMNVDLAAYELIQNPARFDVIVAPNLFGDIIADICGVLVSSRGVTFSGNFDPEGRGVFQTNHGCAHDLAGRDVANPGGQILSLAMLLRENFGLDEAALLIEKALIGTWRAGWRTADIAEPGCQIVGTKVMAEKVVEQVLCSAENYASCMRPPLLLVDFQGDFLDRCGLQPAPEHSSFANRRAPAGLPRTANSRHPHLDHRSHRDKRPAAAALEKKQPLALRRRNRRTQTPAPLQPLENETVIHKSGFNGFAGGELDAALKK